MYLPLIPVKGIGANCFPMEKIRIFYLDCQLKKQVLTSCGDTLFVTVKAKEKGFDLKVYANSLQGVVCRSNHALSLIGVKAPRFYVRTLQKEIGMYDSCRIGHLVTDSNRFRFVNECMIDELSALDNKSFRYDLTKDCLIRSHSYASK